MMILIPIPKGLDLSARKEGESFEIPVTVHLTPKGMEVEAIDGMPVEANESPKEEAEEVEMDEEGLDRAMGRMMPMEGET